MEPGASLGVLGRRIGFEGCVLEVPGGRVCLRRAARSAAENGRAAYIWHFDCFGYLWRLECLRVQIFERFFVHSLIGKQ